MGFILDEIVAYKKGEIEKLKQLHSISEFQDSPYYAKKGYSLEKALRSGENSGVIAEFKRKSPSKGWIHKDADVIEIVKNYQSAGVAGISCLTDRHFFGGGKEDFAKARSSFSGPILRKDFIIDTFQIHETKAMGADIMLLIAAILTKEEIKEFTDLAHEIGLEVLLELHSKEELEKVYDNVDIVGINNRDLRDFSVSLLNSIDMKRYLPEEKVLISESGLEHPGIVCDLFLYGFRGFLMGEYFMKASNPGEKAAEFIADLQSRKRQRA